MAQLVGLIVSRDEAFTKQIGRMLRSGSIPIGIIDERVTKDVASADLVVVDVRGDASGAMASIERWRGAAAGASIFAVADANDSNVILQAMRAGANEFFAWPPEDEAFHSAIRRTAARREATQAAKPAAMLAFFGAKGGAGTTTIAVNCGVELARQTKRSAVIVDLKPGLGEVGLFLGVRSRFTIIDALDNLHRVDSEFLKELVMTHKSGLDVIGGSDQFDRPGAPDAGPIEELFRLLAKQYEYVVVDAGSQINPCSAAALFTAEQVFLVANPDVPSVRNAQRVLDRIRQLGASGERVRLLLNRAAEPFPIPAKQIENAVGIPIHHTFPSDYKTVSTALNSGVPLTLAGNSDMAAQFDRFTRRILEPNADLQPGAPPRKGLLNVDRIASLW
jgi:pilus assembly protein CpaE